MKYTMREYYSGRKRWAVYTPDGELLCVCLYRKGATALVEHLNGLAGKAVRA